VKANKHLPPAHLIARLNPILRGWANYHAHVVSKVTFAKVDHAVFQLLWRWAKRRHPHKPPGWIKEKYFTTFKGRNWVFHGTTNDGGGILHHRLIRLAGVPITRHTKIKGAANPYDPAWEIYFETRLGVKMVDDLKGRRTLLRLWKGNYSGLLRQQVSGRSGSPARAWLSAAKMGWPCLRRVEM